MSIWSGSLIDRIYVNNVRYGRTKGGNENIISFEANEAITSIQYGKTPGDAERRGTTEKIICGMSVITNKKIHGPFATHQYSVCNTKLYYVDIPEDETFAHFLSTNTLYSNNWITGFKNEKG